MTFFPQWFVNRGSNGFREYTDSKEIADINQDTLGGEIEEVPGPSAYTDLNQPQTRRGRMQCEAVNRGLMAGHRDTKDNVPFETHFTGVTQAEMDEHVRQAYEMAEPDQEISVSYPADGEYAELKRRETEARPGKPKTKAG